MFIRNTKTKRRCIVFALISLLSWWFIGVRCASKIEAGQEYVVPNSIEVALHPKVFVIGLSKTGTTSIGDALERLRFQRIGWEDIRSRFLFRSWLAADLNPMISMTQHYDAFEDLPWALVYQEMARAYPDAKFILTLRADEKDWLRSIKEHTARRTWIGHEFVYGAKRAEGHEEQYLEAYRSHNNEVRKFFGNGTNLLEWVVDANRVNGINGDEDLWGNLLRFLRIYDSEDARKLLGSFPWTNRTDILKNKFFLKNFYRGWDQCMYWLEPTLLGVLRLSGWLTSITS
jgi:hypothetical protein